MKHSINFYENAMNQIRAEQNDIDAEWRVLNRHLNAGTLSVEAWKPMHEADIKRIAELNNEYRLVKIVYDWMLEQQIGTLDEDDALQEPTTDEFEAADNISAKYEPDFGF